MPKRLDFTSQKIHQEYLCFKTLAKKVLECYGGLEDNVKVNKVLKWIGPEACVKHELHPFPPETRKNSPRCGTSLTICVPRRMHHENDTEVHGTGERRVSGHVLQTNT